ncbi:MAG: tripartite tricarboxylate transporter substrate binding protein [Burkholderiales bacterium]|nr:MAG: tripartite tricarboxylate transporter substrate binding protein [Burkholderiales bacterium]
MSHATTRRSLLAGAAAAAAGSALGSLAPAAHAQGRWPERPLKLVVPYPPGGNADAIGRWAAERLSSGLGQQVVVENRAGAGASIGAQAVARSAPDGYTLLLAPTAVMAITQHLRKIPYDPEADFAPICCISNSYGLVAARRDLPATTFAEFIPIAKAAPGKFTFGSVGLGTATHLTGEIAALRGGIKLLHVPYKGSAESLTDLVAGRIDLIFDPVALQQVKAGTVKALAATSSVRHPELPDVPTLKEQGIEMPDSGWFGLFAPKGTPTDAIARMAGEIERALAAPGTRETLVKFGQHPQYIAPEAFATRVKADTVMFRDLIAQAGIKLD